MQENDDDDDVIAICDWSMRPKADRRFQRVRRLGLYPAGQKLSLDNLPCPSADRPLFAPRPLNHQQRMEVVAMIQELLSLHPTHKDAIALRATLAELSDGRVGQ